MTSHNNYPAQQQPEFAIRPEYVEYLGTFTSELSGLNYYANGDPEGFQQAVEAKISGAVTEVMPMDDSDGFKLAVLSESLGATRNLDNGTQLIEMIQHSTLLDEADKRIVVGLANNVWAHRQQGATEQQVGLALSSAMNANLLAINRAEQEQGQNKQALKIALLAYSAGAMIQVPELQYGTQLMSEVQAASR